MPLFFGFDLFLEARADILEKNLLVFWKVWRHQKNFLKPQLTFDNVILARCSTFTVADFSWLFDDKTYLSEWVKKWQMAKLSKCTMDFHSKWSWVNSFILFWMRIVVKSLITLIFLSVWVGILTKFSCGTISNFFKIQNSHYSTHRLRTPKEGINQRYLKNWANVADKICFICKLGLNFFSCSEGYFLSGRP